MKFRIPNVFKETQRHRDVLSPKALARSRATGDYPDIYAPSGEMELSQYLGDQALGADYVAIVEPVNPSHFGITAERAREIEEEIGGLNSY